MKYRKLGKSGIEVSALGFGCMRFPSFISGFEHLRPPERPINEEETEQMLLHAVEKGINYFDTAYMYHEGKSEEILGRVLKPYRDKIMITTKLPSMMVRERSDVTRFIDVQLKRLDTEYVDFYLLHGLDSNSWPMMKEYGALDFLEKLKAEGHIRHVGFSFHDDLITFKEIVDSYDWDLCQIQYNYFDENFQAGRKGLEYAANKGLGVVIMEPLRGGSLTDKIPGAVQEIWDSAETKRTPAEWGLKWLYNQPEVSMVLSGMSAMSHLVENIKTAEETMPGSLKDEELSLISKAQEKLQEMLKVHCTSCGYCAPCPNGVDIPMNFSAYNNYFLFDDHHHPIMVYNRMIPEGHRAFNCVECGECEEKCPQHLEIINELKNVHSLLGREGEF